MYKIHIYAGFNEVLFLKSTVAMMTEYVTFSSFNSSYSFITMMKLNNPTIAEKMESNN